MDELDIKLLRALMSESAVAPSSVQVASSLRSIASRLGADDTTVTYRYKRLQDAGALSSWRLIVNPTFFGYRQLAVLVDVQPESAKSDMVRKLKLVHEIVGIANFYGRALFLMIVYGGEESRSRTVELVSRITNAEKLNVYRWPLPQCRAERLTETDVAIIRNLALDARKSLAKAAKEIGVSPRMVRNRVERMRRENVIFALPALNMGGVPGFIPVVLSYSYSRNDAKRAVDRAMVSHFGAEYIMTGLSDPSSGYLVLGASRMTDVQTHLEWAESQPGVAGARIDILTRESMFPEKLIELLGLRNEKAATMKMAR